VVFASYSAIVHGRYRRAAMVSVLAAGFLVAVAFPTVAAPLTLPGRATVVIALVPVVFLGNAVTELRRRAGDSQARLARLEEEHEAATEKALARERARIASELHDVVTHNVSVMIVQAGAARQVLAGSPADARQSLLAVESSGRAAMAELRHLLGLLSPATGPAETGDQQMGEQQAGGQTPWLQPQPGLSRLPALVERVRAAGLDVRLAVGAMPPELPSGVDLAAYRVIQEALTNVLKHAGASPTTVSVAVRDGDLIAEVADAGPQGGAQPAAARPMPGSGRGLLGLRERVALYGGELSAGPQSGGGWVVRARLPSGAAL
jgi:signal transduction histidine kinase